MKNEGSTTTGTPTSYVSNTLHCHYSLTLPQTRTHARTNTLTKNIRFYNNNRQRCLFLSFTHNNDNNNNQITHREKENRIRWIDRFYDIFMILLFYLLYFELFILDWERCIRIGFVPLRISVSDLCSSPYRLGNVFGVLSCVVLYLCVYAYRQLFCHCVWLPCFIRSFQSHIM